MNHLNVIRKEQFDIYFRYNKNLNYILSQYKFGGLKERKLYNTVLENAKEVLCSDKCYVLNMVESKSFLNKKFFLGIEEQKETFFAYEEKILTPVDAYTYGIKINAAPYFNVTCAQKEAILAGIAEEKNEIINGNYVQNP